MMAFEKAETGGLKRSKGALEIEIVLGSREYVIMVDIESKIVAFQNKMQGIYAVPCSL
jgi:hypothetical protein